MQGKPLFQFCFFAWLEDYFSRLLQKSSLQLSDIGTVVPHQASHLSLEHMRKRLRVPESAPIDVMFLRQSGRGLYPHGAA
ncbi:hypothetical protein MJ570_06335 [Escherichia coli]|nr:hypothetical protein MJ570_06335 [Escherichia coli]